MAIIRDEAGNIFNIPDDELKKYLVAVVAPGSGGERPAKLCLEPTFDATHGPHDGWEYAGPTMVRGATAATPKKRAKTSKKPTK